MNVGCWVCKERKVRALHPHHLWHSPYRSHPAASDCARLCGKVPEQDHSAEEEAQRRRICLERPVRGHRAARRCCREARETQGWLIQEWNPVPGIQMQHHRKTLQHGKTSASTSKAPSNHSIKLIFGQQELAIWKFREHHFVHTQASEVAAKVSLLCDNDQKLNKRWNCPNPERKRL